uniref:Uncharacterized protein n=1 Tax=uncultured bacterium contig00033 TaxID=1181522 RepID=A0A806K0A4_9BACT|nr:hypothetical protein [uncultured bacterium contig00033]
MQVINLVWHKPNGGLRDRSIFPEGPTQRHGRKKEMECGWTFPFPSVSFVFPVPPHGELRKAARAAAPPCEVLMLTIHP